MSPLLLGYNTNGFAHHRLDDCLAILAELGYGSVGLTLDAAHLDPFETSPTRIEGLRRTLEELRLVPVVETGARFLLDPRTRHEPTLISPESTGRERRFEFLQRAIEIARDLGAVCVSFWSGRLSSGVDPEQAWSWLVDGGNRLAETAETAGVDLAFEPEPGMLVATMAQAARFLEAVPHPRMRLTLDLGHLLLTETPPLGKVLRHWIGRTANIHIEDMRRPTHEHLAFGEGEMPFEELLGTLVEVHTTVPVNVELSRHRPRRSSIRWKSMLKIF